MDVPLLGLMVFLIVGSIIALELRDLLSAVIAVGMVGLGLAILFLLLGAPDIAITQVVVEVIVVTVLIRTAGRAERETQGRRPDIFAVVSGLVLVVMFLGFALSALHAIPRFGHPLMTVSSWYLESAPALTGASNVVMAILLDFRAYDTLGEATVILTAILGAVVVLRRGARLARPKGKTGQAPQPDHGNRPEHGPEESHHG